MLTFQLINVQCFCVLYFQHNNFHSDHHLSTGALVPETGPKQKNRFICSILRPLLAPATDDFERIIKVWAKCCPGIFYMRWKRDGTGKRPAILITAGITAPWASLSVQQCNHQPSTCNARAAAASPEEGRGRGEREKSERTWNRWIMFHLPLSFNPWWI